MVHGAMGWYLGSELVMGVLWLEHNLKQFEYCLPFPLTARCTRTWNILNRGTSLRRQIGMWHSAAGLCSISAPEQTSL